MGSRYEVEVKIDGARGLKNVNWRHGELRPYAVAWVDPAAKASTKVDVDNGSDPVWDEKLVLPLGPVPVEDAVLAIDVVQADAPEDVKPLVGSARLPLRQVLNEVGIGGKFSSSVQLKRPSGRPHGRVDVKVVIKEPQRYYAPPPPAYAPRYGQETSRDYGGPYGGSYGGSYGGYAQPYSAAPPAGYPYNAPPPPVAGGYQYGAPPQPAYGEGTAYGQTAYGQAEKKKSKFGMGTGLAVGAAAGVLGGLALAEGIDYAEDKIADDAAEKVEDDLAYDDGGDYGGDDF